MTKVANNLKNLVKGSSMRKKLQNSKDYAESPFASTGAIYFQEEVCRYNLR